MKKKYIILLVIIVSAGIIVSREKITPEMTTDVQTETSVVEKKPADATVISENKESKRVDTAKNPKKKTGQTQEENARETENEFLSMIIPSSFSDVKEVRYQEIYNIYQKTSFYLSEVAADHLETNKENLIKAFKGLSIYFKEGSMTDQMDSALIIIQQEKPGMFEEALNDLSKKDQVIIKSILKLQSESE